jgi:hypothetical protein
LIRILFDIYISFNNKKNSGFYITEKGIWPDYTVPDSSKGDKAWYYIENRYDIVSLSDYTGHHAIKINWKPRKGERVIAANAGELVNYEGIYDTFTMSTGPVWLTKKWNKKLKTHTYKEYRLKESKGVLGSTSYDIPPDSRRISMNDLSKLELSYGIDFTGDSLIGPRDYNATAANMGVIPLSPEALSRSYEFPGFKQIPYPYLISGPGLPNTYDNYPDSFGEGFQPAQYDHPNDSEYRWYGVTGSKANDIIIGGKYIDVINGGDGDDIIYGGNNYSDPFPADSTSGRIGYQNAGINGVNDILTGGRGRDTFILNTVNTVGITDFELGVDRIRFYKEETHFGGSDFPSLGDLQIRNIDDTLYDAVLNSFGYPIAYINFTHKPTNFSATTISDMING